MVIQNTDLNIGYEEGSCEGCIFSKNIAGTHHISCTKKDATLSKNRNSRNISKEMPDSVPPEKLS
jgi:hypothetical protein